MPSLKPVKSLFDLSLCASRDLVISAAKNIEKIYPSASGLSYDVPGCSDAVLPMQGHLRDLLPATVYESLFQLVSQQVSEVSDERIVFSTFIYDNVNLTTMALNYRFFVDDIASWWMLVTGESEIEILKHARHVEFWLKQIPKLAKLVELDLQTVYNDDMIFAFIRTCTELKSLILPKKVVSPAEASIPLLIHTTQLSNLDCPLLGACFEVMSSGVVKKWATRKVHVIQITAAQVNCMVHLCPQLVNLHISPEVEDYEEALQILASCPQKFYKLSLHIHFDQEGYFAKFLDCKGIYIRDLTIFSLGFPNTLDILILVSKTCKNLTRLEINSNSGDQDPGTRHVVSFPKLERLTVSTWPFGNQHRSLVFVEHCLADAPNVTSLAVRIGRDEDVFEEELIQLFATQQAKQLTDLMISCSKELLSTNLTRQIFEWCTNLRTFTIGCVDAEAKLYLTNVKEENKLKNVDMSLKYF